MNSDRADRMNNRISPSNVPDTGMCPDGAYVGVLTGVSKIFENREKDKCHFSLGVVITSGTYVGVELKKLYFNIEEFNYEKNAWEPNFSNGAKVIQELRSIGLDIKSWSNIEDAIMDAEGAQVGIILTTTVSKATRKVYQNIELYSLSVEEKEQNKEEKKEEESPNKREDNDDVPF